MPLLDRSMLLSFGRIRKSGSGTHPSDRVGPGVQKKCLSFPWNCLQKAIPDLRGSPRARKSPEFVSKIFGCLASEGQNSFKTKEVL